MIPWINISPDDDTVKNLLSLENDGSQICKEIMGDQVKLVASLLKVEPLTMMDIE